MFRRFVSIMTVALLALVVLAACGDAEGEEGEEASQDVTTRVPAEGAPPMPAPEGSPAAGGEQPAGQQPPAGEQPAAAALTIEGVDIAWVFNGQRSAPGQPVSVTVAPGATISLPNTGATLHNFAVDALGIDVDMPVGETVEATIPADAAPEEYEYYCNVPGHKPAGMVGTLVVQ